MPFDAPLGLEAPSPGREDDVRDAVAGAGRVCDGAVGRVGAEPLRAAAAGAGAFAGGAGGPGLF